MPFKLPEFSIYFNFTLKSQENLIPTYNHGELKHRKTSKQTWRPLLLPTAQSFWAPCQTASAATTPNLPRAWQACKAVLTPWESCSFLNSTEGVCVVMLLVLVLKDEGTARASFSKQAEPSRHYHCQRTDKLKPTVLNTTNLKHTTRHLLSVPVLSVCTILSFRFQIWPFQYAVYGCIESKAFLNLKYLKAKVSANNRAGNCRQFKWPHRKSPSVHASGPNVVCLMCNS